MPHQPARHICALHCATRGFCQSAYALRKSVKGEEIMAELRERDIMRRVAWRLVPFLGLGYYVNALDRSNVAVAALTMNKSLGFTAAEYGLGAGAFFWSYVLFQVPANMLLTRLGARRWLTVIILAWALCSGATALVTGVTSFVIVRFLLGIAEAGYFSGVIFFLTCWFPDP
jgi:ACS family tartrate transporter-like MFS transporter